MNDAERFINELENLESVFDIENNNLYKSGYYGYFSISNEKELVVNHEIDQNYHIPFIFQHNSEDLSDINSVIDCKKYLETHSHTDLRQCTN